MNIHNSAQRYLALSLAVFLTGFVSATALASSRDLMVTPSEVHIRETFQGASISISATVPKQSLSILEIKGESHPLRLLRKGRRGGLWMNVGEVQVKAAPSLYLMLTSGSGDFLQKDIGADFGYPALKKTVQFSGKTPKSGTDVLFEQFLKLKESEGLYGIFPGAIHVKETGVEEDRIQSDAHLPTNIAPGTYQVALSIVKDGKLLEQQITKFTVKMSGLPQLLLSMALEHSMLYGSLAVVIAILSGFIMGFVFKSKSAH
ncbi:MAG: TIGR02186 family protein [Deltaproteobacteria bacterium]|nr:TIGR02186 family protein [Deltaproteobacteria bacterium]